jgi:hypothetical protein
MSSEKSVVISPILCPLLRIYNIYHNHDKISQIVICCGPVFIILTQILGITLHYLRISCLLQYRALVLHNARCSRVFGDNHFAHMVLQKV